jgi:hypothetical protein
MEWGFVKTRKPSAMKFSEKFFNVYSISCSVALGLVSLVAALGFM